MSHDERFIRVATQAGVLTAEAGTRLLAQCMGTGRPAWELACALLPAERVVQVLGRCLAEPSSRGEVLGELGRGGMGRVLRLRDPGAGREVAQKVLLDPRAASAEARVRLLREARITAQLEHPCIVPVYAVEADEQAPSFTMRLVRGRGLDEVLKAARAAPADAPVAPLARLFLKVCEAIAFAHSRGVIHRDLKPANVMVGDFGEVQVMDWGLCRLESDAREAGAPAVTDPDGQAAITQDGVVLGTPSYMPPEQADGRREDLTARSDVYSLGALLYELLTLEAPFVGDSRMAVLRKVLMEPPVPPRRRAPDRRIPRELEAIALAALEKDPARRYASARDLADDVARYLEGRPVSVLSLGPVGRAVKWAARHAELTAAAVLVALAALGAAAGASAVAARTLAQEARLAETKAAAEADARRAADEKAHAEAERSRFASEAARLAQEATSASGRRAAALVPYFEVADLLDRNVPRKVLHEAVIPALRRSVEADPTFAEGWLALAEAYVARNVLSPEDIAGVREAYERALAASSSSGGDAAAARALDGLARLEEATGHEAAARERVARLIAIAPGGYLARLAMARSVADPAQRLAALAALVEQVPYRSEVVADYAHTLIEVGKRVPGSLKGAQVRDGIDRLTTAVRCLGPQPSDRVNLMNMESDLAMLHESLGQWDRALRAVDAAQSVAAGAVDDREVDGLDLQGARLLFKAGRAEEGLARIAHFFADPASAAGRDARMLRGLDRVDRLAADDRERDDRADAAAALADLSSDLDDEPRGTEAWGSLLAAHAVAAAEAFAFDQAAATLERLIAVDPVRAFAPVHPRIPVRRLRLRLRAACAGAISWLEAQGQGGRARALADALARAQAAREPFADAIEHLGDAYERREPGQARDAHAAADLGLRALEAEAGGPAERRALLRLRLLRARGQAALDLGRPADAVTDLRVVVASSEAAPSDVVTLATAVACAAAPARGPLPAPARDEVLALLEDAVGRGYTNRALIVGTEVFHRLRGDARYDALVERMKR